MRTFIGMVAAFVVGLFIGGTQLETTSYDSKVSGVTREVPYQPDLASAKINDTYGSYDSYEDIVYEYADHGIPLPSTGSVSLTSEEERPSARIFLPRHFER